MEKSKTGSMYCFGDVTEQPLKTSLVCFDLGRKTNMSKAPVCPHCGSEMDPIQMPIESSWGGELHHVCFNDSCSYFTDSWKALEKQGIAGTGYRCRMDPRGGCGPAPVRSSGDLKDLVVKDIEEIDSLSYFRPEDLSRDDETSDEDFYAIPRFVDHLDSIALDTVEQIYARLVTDGATVLDLMAGPDSHLNKVSRPGRIVGLGLNETELKANPALSEYIVKDLNSDPRMPFPNNTFDVVINTVSVDYLTKPIEVFVEVSRVLRPEGLFIVVFSNRMFPPKAVNIWKSSTERQRVGLVRKFFSLAQQFVIGGYYESTGKERPKDDKYAGLGIPSDPVYAVWGQVKGKFANSTH
jgi:SAM-dependent methyltransferase